MSDQPSPPESSLSFEASSTTTLDKNDESRGLEVNNDSQQDQESKEEEPTETAATAADQGSTDTGDGALSEGDGGGGADDDGEAPSGASTAANTPLVTIRGGEINSIAPLQSKESKTEPPQITSFETHYTSQPTQETYRQEKTRPRRKRSRTIRGSPRNADQQAPTLKKAKFAPGRLAETSAVAGMAIVLYSALL